MRPDFEKYPDNLLPVIIQDHTTNKVLMLGFMTEDAFNTTAKERYVTFYSRSKQRLWKKGETSGNTLKVIEIFLDCDSDALLIKAEPRGPICHTGADTCFNETNDGFTLNQLEKIITERKTIFQENSYTSGLFKSGINKIAQKVGEEAVELVIESKDNNRQRFLDEAADLLFHYLVLLKAKDENLDEVIKVLKQRHKK